MDASVIIPTRGRPAKVAACVGCLQRQDIPTSQFEVLVGVDGADDGEARAIAEVASGGVRAIVRDFPRRNSEPGGQAAVRNRLVEQARGEVLLFLNDDMLPEPGWVRTHLEAHARADAAAKPAVFLGDSPWVKATDGSDSMLDRLIRETSMVFFYDQMPGSHAYVEHNGRAGMEADAGRDWGFRHGWLLNLSLRADMWRSVGGLTVFPSTYGYEDDELAFRLHEKHGMPVRFLPAARAWHDHRYTPAAYFEREHRLGYAAWGFARTTPACARAMFGRDVTAREETEYCREFTARERRTADRVRETFGRIAALPAAALPRSADSVEARTMVRAVYEQHLLLKRYEWRRGLLDASGGVG